MEEVPVVAIQTQIVQVMVADTVILRHFVLVTHVIPNILHIVLVILAIQSKFGLVVLYGVQAMMKIAQQTSVEIVDLIHVIAILVMEQTQTAHHKVLVSAIQMCLTVPKIIVDIVHQTNKIS